MTDKIPFAKIQVTEMVTIALSQGRIPCDIEDLERDLPQLSHLLAMCWGKLPNERPAIVNCLRQEQTPQSLTTPESQISVTAPGFGQSTPHKKPPLESSHGQPPYELNKNPKSQTPAAMEPSASSPSMVVNPDPLEPFFKTVQERNLIRYYVQTSTNIMMALPSALNPILSVYLPIILSSAASAPATPPIPLVSPPTSPDVSVPIAMAQQQQNGLTFSIENNQSVRASIEALRLSLLGVAAIHQAYLLTKSGDENREVASSMWNLANNLRVMASKYLGVAVASNEGCRSDAALGACVSIALIDIFAGGYNYTLNMTLGKTLVSLRGGPAAMVRYSVASVQDGGSSPTFEGPNYFVNSGSGSPPKAPNARKTLEKGALISTGRLLLEILTVYDTFSTLTSGEQPGLLRPGETKWWFEGDQNNYHLYSVENKFGMSRSIVELFARVSSFLNRHRHSPEKSSGIETVEGNSTPDLRRPGTPTPSLSSLRESPPPPGSPLCSLHAEGCSLLREVEAWNDGHIPVNQMHPRVKFGNYALKSALLILLLREAFNLGPNDPRVQKCVEMTLLAALKASADFTMSVDLTWPVIIAGCQCSGPFRDLTVRALEGF
ncbi:hypothetical protein FRC00_004257, partial [Tulasnella sp. 408]